MPVVHSQITGREALLPISVCLLLLRRASFATGGIPFASGRTAGCYFNSLTGREALLPISACLPLTLRSRFATGGVPLASGRIAG